MLFFRRPYHLSEDEADRWMRAQAAPLAEHADGVLVSRLQNPAARGGGDWDWLIELECEGVEDAARTARGDVLRSLVADLRLLGMRPSLVLVHGTTPLEG